MGRNADSGIAVLGSPAGTVNNLDPFVKGGQVVQNGPGPIGRAPVGENDLVGKPGLSQEGVGQRSDVSGFVEYRNNDADRHNRAIVACAGERGLHCAPNPDSTVQMLLPNTCRSNHNDMCLR